MLWFSLSTLSLFSFAEMARNFSKYFFVFFHSVAYKHFIVIRNLLQSKVKIFQNGGLDEKLKINNEFTGLKIKKGISVKDARG